MCALMLKSSHCPDGKTADALASTLACTTAADALVNFRMYVPQLKFSHRPHGRLMFCSLFAGRRCRRRGWHSDHLIVHHQWELCMRWELTMQGAHSCSKLPIAPMGDSHVLLVVCRAAVSSSLVAQ
jgi:hypothetical protein